MNTPYFGPALETIFYSVVGSGFSLYVYLRSRLEI